MTLTYPLRYWIPLLFSVSYSFAVYSPCSQLKVKNGEVRMMQNVQNGKYPSGSKALVSCHSGYHLSQGEIISCQNGVWIASDNNRVKSDHFCESLNENRCESLPELRHGYYRPLTQTYIPGSSEGVSDYAVGFEFEAICERSFALNCQTQETCGKIICTLNGNWAPIDGNPIVCSAIPQTVVSGNARDIRFDDAHGLRNPSATQNYLILALALVCIVGVAALTIALLRRPLFCKKRNQSGLDTHVVVTAASPRHTGGGVPNGAEDLDSIPVAMNTGIFIPGADYNLQDYTLQEGPLCGTAVFGK